MCFICCFNSVPDKRCQNPTPVYLLVPDSLHLALPFLLLIYSVGVSDHALLMKKNYSEVAGNGLYQMEKMSLYAFSMTQYIFLVMVGCIYNHLFSMFPGKLF